MKRRTAGMTAQPGERIIAWLKQAAGEEISSERLCADLGISRAAVWKHIQGLRGQGYRIEAAPRRGYRLCASPDTPLATEVMPLLTTRMIGRHYVFLESVDSTNRQAALQAESGAPEGTVVVADGQTVGRGRMGRAWVSPAGLNAYLSILLMPRVEPARVSTLPLVAGLAVALAIERIAPGLRPLVKWPNDILINGRKACGILCELEAETDRIRRVVCGIGVNLNQTEFSRCWRRWPRLSRGRRARAFRARPSWRRCSRSLNRCMRHGCARVSDPCVRRFWIAMRSRRIRSRWSRLAARSRAAWPVWRRRAP